jgi:hypothetical protein
MDVVSAACVAEWVGLLLLDGDACTSSISLSGAPGSTMLELNACAAPPPEMILAVSASADSVLLP